MELLKKHTEPHKDQKKPDKIKRLYNNYESCKNCKSRNKCYSVHKHTESSQNMNQKCKKQ